MKTDFDNYLIEKGYRTFKRSEIDSIYVENLFQKRFDDDIGKKYFITIKKWQPIEVKWSGDIIGPSYEYTTQFYFGNENNPVNLDFFGGWNLEDAENKIEEIWKLGNFEYYEKWEER